MVHFPGNYFHISRLYKLKKNSGKKDSRVKHCLQVKDFGKFNKTAHCPYALPSFLRYIWPKKFVLSICMHFIASNAVDEPTHNKTRNSVCKIKADNEFCTCLLNVLCLILQYILTGRSIRSKIF